MTLADALRDIDLAALRRDLQAAALHQDRCRRQAEHLQGLQGFSGTQCARANIDITVSALCGADRLAAVIGQILADEMSVQPPVDGAPTTAIDALESGRRVSLEPPQQMQRVSGPPGPTRSRLLNRVLVLLGKLRPVVSEPFALARRIS